MRKGQIIAIVLFTIFLISGCSDDEALDMDKFKKENAYEGDEFAPSEESIFNLTSDWENQNGDTVQLKVVAGKPTILAMIYTHCEYSCPLITADMKQLHNLIPEKRRDQVNFLIVSIDPIHDRPDTLSRFMKKEQMDEKYWTMLTGTETKIRELAAVLGFKYKKSSLMDYAHSNLITVLNPKGEIIEQINGFGSDKKKIIEKVLKYTNED
ncbi:MAG: SCO family protein [Ignavibacteriae bacterium HGW-Ignavibacteriae-4]|jgi:protein SCO1/2|nr:MAG: SCO family protein [Ignavibacteriae bacterium HGW-Ignavibacteriae-4]